MSYLERTSLYAERSRPFMRQTARTVRVQYLDTNGDLAFFPIPLPLGDPR